MGQAVAWVGGNGCFGWLCTPRSIHPQPLASFFMLGSLNSKVSDWATEQLSDQTTDRPEMCAVLQGVPATVVFQLVMNPSLFKGITPCIWHCRFPMAFYALGHELKLPSSRQKKRPCLDNSLVPASTRNSCYSETNYCCCLSVKTKWMRFLLCTCVWQCVCVWVRRIAKGGCRRRWLKIAARSHLLPTVAAAHWRSKDSLTSACDEVSKRLRRFWIAPTASLRAQSIGFCIYVRREKNKTNKIVFNMNVSYSFRHFEY